MVVEVFLGLGIFLAACWLRRRPSKTCGKNVLVVGGTSGLGLELARLLYRRNSTVAITSRTLDNAERAVGMILGEGAERALDEDARISPLQADVTAEKDLEAFGAGYDCIFYMPGFCISKYFEQHRMDDFARQMELNFLSAVRLLLHFQKRNGRPFTFLVVSSTAAWFQFPGYSSYAPSKCALRAFAGCAGPELARKQIDLRVFACPTMDTSALERENRDKPGYTWDIERTNQHVSPGDAARFLLDNIHHRKTIVMDWFTYFNVIKDECECMADYVLFPVAVLVVLVAKCYASWKFAKSGQTGS